MTPAGIFDHRVGKFWALSRFCVQGAPYGGLIGTVTDAARFLALHVDPQAHPDVLSEDAVLAMQQTTAHGRKLDVGLGWFRRRSDPPNARHYWEHLGGGGGFFNTMRVYPELKLGLVAMGNPPTGTTYGSFAQPLKAGIEQAQLLTDCRFDSYHTRD